MQKIIKMTIEIRVAKKDEFKEIARFASEINKNEELQCLHCSHNEQSFLDDLNEILEKYPEPVIAAFENGNLVGALVSDYDSEKKRVWLWGPFVGQENWEVLGQLLLNKLFELVNRKDNTFDSFSNLKNINAYNLYIKNGFIKKGITHIYSAEKEKANLHIKEESKELTNEFYDQFIKLHDESFSNSYYTAKEIIALTNQDKKVFITTDNQILTGYIFFNSQHSENEAYIDFIAIKDGFRNKGLGRKLLSQCLVYCFNNRNLNKVSLCVNDDKQSAKSLYKSVGFKLLYSGLSSRLAY